MSTAPASRILRRLVTSQRKIPEAFFFSPLTSIISTCYIVNANHGTQLNSDIRDFSTRGLGFLFCQKNMLWYFQWSLRGHLWWGVPWLALGMRGSIPLGSSKKIVYFRRFFYWRKCSKISAPRLADFILTSGKVNRKSPRLFSLPPLTKGVRGI